MNKLFRFSLLLFLILTLTAFYVSASGRKEKEEPAVQEEDINNVFAAETEMSEADVSLPSVWEYQVEITMEGSRSEGRIGHLFYMGTEIGPWFDYIIINGTGLEYIPMQNIWDRSGYRKITRNSCYSIVTDISLQHNYEITDEELTKGWYEAVADEKHSGTPSEWVQCKSGELYFWADPARLNEIAETMGIDRLDVPQMVPVKK